MWAIGSRLSVLSASVLSYKAVWQIEAASLSTYRILSHSLLALTFSVSPTLHYRSHSLKLSLLLFHFETHSVAFQSHTFSGVKTARYLTYLRLKMSARRWTPVTSVMTLMSA